MVDSRGHLRIERKKGWWRDRLASYKIVVDDKVVGGVRNGAATELSVDPGHHTVYLVTSWHFGSPVVDFNVAQGERARVRCWANGGMLGFWRMFFSPWTYIALSPPITESTLRADPSA